MLSIKSAQIISLFLLAYVQTVIADEKQGLEIAIEMKQQEQGFINYTADMIMELISISGKKDVRKLHVMTREVAGDGNQSLAVFDSPADVKGTGFLSHTHIDEEDDQWLYLPSLKRVKRISPNNKTAPFMGSEFAYEDLTSFEVENYRYNYAGDENREGIEYYLLDRFPISEYSGYSRERLWVEKERYITVKTEYYDENGELLKTLISDEFNLYLDRFWYPHVMTMQNHESGKSSILIWENFIFRDNLRDSDFNPNSLTRAR